MRKWAVNGCAYYEEGSDTNAASIEKKNKAEKEIEDLNDFADLLRPEQRYYTNLIKKVIEERLKDREKIKALEEENMQKDLEKIGIEECTEASMKEIIEQYYTANEDCVPKQKIKDKIEELKNKLKFIACSKDCNKCFDKKGNAIYRGSGFLPCFVYHQIKILQELLKESEK